jgi:hypothetical protein
MLNFVTRFTFLTILTLVSQHLHAQCQNWEWGVAPESVSPRQIYDVEPRPGGGVVVTGTLSAGVSIAIHDFEDTTVIVPALETSMFVAAYADDGTCLWVRTPNSGQAYFSGEVHVAIDDLGYVYVASSFRGSNYFDQFHLYSQYTSISEMYLLKLSPMGQVIFADKITDSGNSLGGSLTLIDMQQDHDNKLVLTGEYVRPNNTPIYFDTIPFYQQGFFVVKFDTGFNGIWGHRATEDICSKCVAIDDSNNVYFTGEHYTLGSNSVTISVGDSTQQQSLNNGIQNIMFCVKISSSGTVQYININGDHGLPSNNFKGIAITIDTANCPVVVVHHSSVPAAEIWTMSPVTGTILNTINNVNYVVVQNPRQRIIADEEGYFYLFRYPEIDKINYSGIQQWAKPFSGNAVQYPRVITLDSSNNVYISARVNSGAFNFNGYTAPIGGGYSATYLAKITHVVSPPSVDTAAFCEGETAYSVAEGHNPIWYSDPAATQFLDIGDSLLLGSLSSGTYVYYAVDSLNGCTSDVVAAFVVVHPQVLTPTITALGDTVFCQGDSVSLISSVSSGLLWSDGVSTGQSITVFDSGTFSVVNTDLNGCSSGSDSIQVLVNPLPVPQVIASGNILTSSLSGSFQWYLDGQIISGANSQSYVALQTGNYTVEVTDSNGCTGVSQPEYIEVIPDSIVGLDTKSEQINIYPNPATDNFLIEIYAGDYTDCVVEIIDPFGRVLATQSMSVKSKWNIEPQVPGIYLVRVRMRGYLVTKRIIVL